MSGLDIAAGAVSLLGFLHLIITKVVPILADTSQTDDGVRKLDREIKNFKSLLRAVDTYFEDEHRVLHPRELQYVQSMRNHIALCEKTAKELLDRLPNVQNQDRGVLAQARTQFTMLLQSDYMTSLINDISSLKATLELWLQIFQLESTRHSSILENQNQATIQTQLARLCQKIENLELELRTRKIGRLNIDHSSSTRDVSVTRNGEQCLTSARTVYEACTTKHLSIATSEPDLDEDGNNRESLNSTGIPENFDGFTPDQLIRMINTSVHNARKSRQIGQHDKAALHQGQAIAYSQLRTKFHGIEFRDERAMLATLADLHLEGQMFVKAADILEGLLVGENDPSQAAALRHKLAAAYLAHGKYRSAAKHANKVNEWKQKNLEMENDSIIETLTLLSTIYDKMGERNVSREFTCDAQRHRILRFGPFDQRVETAIRQGLPPREVQSILDEENDTNGERGVLALKAFHFAVAFDREEVVKYLWSSYATVRESIEVPNKVGMTPLISATSWGHESIVRFLLEKGGANVTARFTTDNSEDTALLIAADKQFKTIVWLLLCHDANPKDCNRHGRNALHRAMGPPNGGDDPTRTEIVLMLLRRDREGLLRAKCTADKHALHLAAEAGNKPMIELLLSQGAQIEATDCAGRTPLFCAIDMGQAGAVEALVESGANLNVKDNLGRTIKKAADRPTGDARKIKKTLKAAKSEEATRPGSRKPSAISIGASVNDGRSSLSLRQVESQGSAISPLSPPSRKPSIFPASSWDERGSIDTLSMRSTGTTASRWGKDLESRFGRRQ